MDVPEPQHVFSNCLVTDVIDGDTVEISVTRRVRVRLRDCWAPETKRTRHPSEKNLGVAAKAALTNIAIARECTLVVKPDGDDRLLDTISFDRVVGEVFLNSGESIGEVMIERGHAWPTKRALHEALAEYDQDLFDDSPI